MKIEKLDTTLVPVWFPAAKDPHGTVKFSNAEGRGVGLVKLVLPSADGPSPRHVNDDRWWLLFKGNKLRVDGREGQFIAWWVWGKLVRMRKLRLQDSM